MNEHRDNVAQQALDADRRSKAIRMRVRGHTWGRIAEACGYPSAASALRDVGVAMKEATARAEETADDARNTAEMQLSTLLTEAWNMVEEGAGDSLDDSPGAAARDAVVKLRAIDEARRLVADIAKLKGADKPAPEAASDGGLRIVGVAVEDII